MSRTHIVMLFAFLLTACGSAEQPAADRKAAEQAFEKARVFAGQRMTQECLAELDHAAALDKTWTAPLEKKAEILERSSHYSQAYAALKEAVKRSPENSKLLLWLLRIPGYASSAETEAYSRQAVKLDPENPLTHYNLAMAIAGSGDPKRYDEAEKAFNESLKLAPEGILPLTELGKLKVQRREYDGAANILRSAEQVLDDARNSGQVAKTVVGLEEWLQMRRAATFWRQAALQKSNRLDEANAEAKMVADLTEQTSIIRQLRDRAYASPPDMESRRMIEQIMQTCSVPRSVKIK